MSGTLQQVLQSHPWPGLLIVVLMAWLEYVFPPVPGDSTMLFACFMAGTGALPLPAALAACFAGSIGGAVTAYLTGRRLGRSYFFLRSSWAHAELDRLERGFARFGSRLLAVNRFLPGVRGLFLYAAGIARLGWRSVLIYSTLSNALWLGLIALAGTRLGRSWEQVQVVFRRYVWGLGIVLAVYVLATLLRAWRRRSGTPLNSLS